MRAAVLLIGDELLGGVITDLNVQTTARLLGPRGGGVVRVETVGDDPAEISATLQRLATIADLVVISGGLGPTDDDRTREGVALALGTPVIENEELGRRLGDWLEARGLDRHVARRQASFPGGTVPVRNPVGSAFGFRGRIGAAEFWVLPGVPAEFREMMVELTVAIPEAAGRDWERIVATMGRGETQVAARLEEGGFRPAEGISQAFLPGPGGVRMRLFAPEGAPRERFDRDEARLREILGDWALPETTIALSLVRTLQERGLKLATAESCTGGLIGARITDVPGASSVYLGGVVAYDNAVKTRQLGVPLDLLDGPGAPGAVSEPVATAMAVGARTALNADLAVSVTGIAGPGGGSAEKPVGTVWIGIADADGAEARHYVFHGPRDMVRERTVNKALEMAYRRARKSAHSPQKGVS